MNIFIADLKELFEEYGTISSAKIVTDRETGRSKGFGFVEMEDEAEAQRAIQELNDAEYDGRTLAVSVARPRTERPRGGSGGGGGYNRGGGGGGGGDRSRGGRY